MLNLKEAVFLDKPEKNRTNHSLKTLFVSSDAYKMSGAFLSLLALNKELNQNLDIKTHVILPYYGSGNSLVKESQISHEVIPSSDWIVPIGTKMDLHSRAAHYEAHTRNIGAATWIAKSALKGEFDVIHSNSSYTYVGALAAKMACVPHVWHLREFLEEDQGKQIIHKKRGYHMISKSDAVIAISRSLFQKYEPIVSKEKLHLIYNGIDTTTFEAMEKTIFEKDVPVFLFISGSDSPNKGRFELIDACSILKKQGEQFKLWFVGWCGDSLKSYVKEQGLESVTEFWGYQKFPQSFYQTADITFICSKFEAFGRTTVEAMMSGSLVIGADTAGTKELIQDQVTGLLYHSGDANDLARKITYALNQKEQMKAIAKKGRQNAIENFSARANASNIANLYNQVVGKTERKSKIRKYRAKINIALSRVIYGVRLLIGVPIYKKLADLLEDRPKVTEQIPGKPHVSVIVPIFNVEQYLRQCLDSIIAQTEQNLEIICVNDGSTDNSGAIIREYAQKDSRIIIVDKENSGYGASMNIGLSKATGDYIAIVEPDDFIDRHMYEDLYKCATKNGNVDIIKSSYWQYFDDLGDGEKLLEAPILSACHPPKKIFDVWAYPEIIYHHPSIWSCLYRNEFLKRNNIRFVEAKGAGWVDNPFLFETFCRANSIMWLPKAYYNYRQTNPNASSFLKDCTLPFQRTKEMLDFAEANNITDIRILGSVYKRILYNTAAALENPYYDKEKDDALIISELRRINPDFLKEKRVRDVERKAYHLFMDKQ